MRRSGFDLHLNLLILVLASCQEVFSITIGFSENNREVNEGVGNAELCVEVMGTVSGQFSRDITVVLGDRLARGNNL